MLKAEEMGELKMGFYILSTMGFLTWICGIIANIDNVKSTILFLGGIVFAGYKIYNIHLDTVKKRDDMRDAKKQRLLNEKLKNAENNK